MNQPDRAGQGRGVALCPMQWDDLAAVESRGAEETVISGEVDVMIEFGSATIPHEKCQQIRPGAVVPLDKEDRDAVDIYVDGRIVAAGEVFVDDNKYCIRVSKLVAP